MGCCESNITPGGEVNTDQSVQFARKKKLVDLQGQTVEVPEFSSRADRDRAFNEYLDQIRSENQSKQYISAFQAQAYIYHGYALFNHQFLTEEKTISMSNEYLGEDVSSEKDIVIEGLQ